MSCTNNINITCGCENNPCGCKTSSDDVVYQGPDLSCTGVSNCDTLTEVIQSIDGFICSPELVQTIINNILNNESLYDQFTTIVNNTLDCQTVWDCINAQTTTTTTTAIPTCSVYNLTTSGPSGFPGDNAWSAIDCYTGLPVDGTITFPTSVNTGCIIDSSLVLGVKVEIIETNACPTTTTTTTGAEECHYYSLQGDTAPGIWIATLCGSEGAPVYVGGELTPGQSEETPCIIPSTLEMYGVSIKLDRGVCPTTTTTTTT
jgi:hypothetical protein